MFKCPATNMAVQFALMKAADELFCKLVTCVTIKDIHDVVEEHIIDLCAQCRRHGVNMKGLHKGVVVTTLQYRES